MHLNYIPGMHQMVAFPASLFTSEFIITVGKTSEAGFRFGVSFQLPPATAWAVWIRTREAAVPREAAAQECCHLRKPDHYRELGAFQSVRLSRRLAAAMAELIQKKLQGEVEKYQQLQKGKGLGRRSFPQIPALTPNPKPH